MRHETLERDSSTQPFLRSLGVSRYEVKELVDPYAFDMPEGSYTVQGQARSIVIGVFIVGTPSVYWDLPALVGEFIAQRSELHRLFGCTQMPCRLNGGVNSSRRGVRRIKPCIS